MSSNEYDIYLLRCEFDVMCTEIAMSSFSSILGPISISLFWPINYILTIHCCFNVINMNVFIIYYIYRIVGMQMYCC